MTMTEPEIDGRLGVTVAELSGEVLRLRRHVDELQGGSPRCTASWRRRCGRSGSLSPATATSSPR